MRVCLLRIVSAFLFASALISSARISAQSNGTPAVTASATTAQQEADSAKYVVPGCAIDHTKATDADKALQARKYPDAERLYGEALTADPASSPAMAGLVRTTLAEGKLPDALAMATKYSTARPNDPVLLDALGEVRFRRGEIGEAAHALNQSSRINPCNGRTHYDAARFLNLSSMHASAQHELEIAHAQAPEDVDIMRVWRATHAVPPTAEQRLATLKQRLDNPALTDAQKEATQAAIKSVETAEKGSCELVTPLTEVKLPIVPISTGADTTLASMYESALEVQINGKKKRLEIDTGASGLLLTSAVAKSAGLVPELQVKGSGIGDDGAVNMFVTHVDDIKIGKMEFKNCRVGVLAPGNAMERMPDMDGLIGPDVFRNYVVTLNIPEMEMRLGALPTRPGEEARTTSLATTGGDETPVSVADSAKDRYVAPEMKDWTPVFRSAHMLIFPTVVGSAPVKLFLMDTGASRNMISPAAAREVTQISDFTNHSMQGISGKVQKMLIADKVAMTFAGVRQMNYGMDAFDSSLMSRSTGVDISGIIGFPALRELVISIDYRDSLVHVVYDPRKGYHAHSE